MKTLLPLWGRSRPNGISFYIGYRTAYRFTIKEKNWNIRKIPLFIIIYILQFALLILLIYKYREQTTPILFTIYRIFFKTFLKLLDPFVKPIITSADGTYDISDKIYLVSLKILATIIIAIILGSLLYRLLGKTLRFHWCEHVVIEFYHEFHRAPTLDEAKKVSPFSKRCGSTQVAIAFFTLITSVFLYKLKLYVDNTYAFTFLYVLGTLLSFKLYKYLNERTKLLTCFQLFLLMKPDDDMFSMVCEAFKKMLKQLE